MHTRLYMVISKNMQTGYILNIVTHFIVTSLCWNQETLCVFASSTEVSDPRCKLTGEHFIWRTSRMTVALSYVNPLKPASPKIESRKRSAGSGTGARRLININRTELIHI